MASPHTSKYALLSILILGFIQGIIYAAIIPPWWHYDEPGHFEYAWLVANLPSWPKAGQYDQSMRKQMALSLTKYKWYQIRGIQPDLSGSTPIPIGVPQTGRNSAYYFLASLPLRLMDNTDITIQYYAARSISFILYLMILAVIWYALGEVLREGHPLRWMVPIFLAMLPAFIDTMTAINSDVAAVLASSLFLWASLKLIMRGYSIPRLLFMGFTLVFCYLSKDTAWFTFLLTPFVLILGLLRGRFTWAMISLSIIGTGVMALTMLELGAPLGWYQNPAQPSPMRNSSPNSPVGKYVFQINYPSANVSGQISQFLVPDTANSLAGQTVTLGGWFWSDSAIRITSPYIRFSAPVNGTFNYNSINSPQTSLTLNTHPTFYRFIIQAPAGAQYGTIIIPYTLPSATSKIFVNGLVLALGEYSNTPPQFADPNGTQGTWDGRKFQNIIRNGSAEQDNLRFRPWAQEVLNKLTVSLFDPPFILANLLDRHGIGWYYRSTFSNLFDTFWASLAATRVEIPASANGYLIILTFIGMAGTFLWIWRNRKSLRWDILFLLGLSLLISGALVVLRGISGLEVDFPVISWARYLDPAILPLALILCAGWLECLNLLKGKFGFTDETRNAIFAGGVIGISALGIANAIKAFYPRWWVNWQALIFLVIFQIIAVQAIILFEKARSNRNAWKS